MARNFFGIEKGLDVYAENGDLKLRLLTGSGAPTANAEQNAAPLGSLYVDEATGDLYQKKAMLDAAGDWEVNGSASAQLGNWRPERVDAHTGDVLVAGAQDPTAWTDNDDGTAAAAFTVGHYVLDGNCALWEITAISAPNITLAAAANPPVADDMFAVRYNMPDPAGQENQAIITFTGSACVKVADVDFANATGVSIVAGYTPASGNVIVGDTVQGAIEKLDGNNDAQDTLLGTAQGAVDLGTFTGVTIPDNSTVKGALQSLETAHEALDGVVAEIDANVDDLITLSGVAENSTDLGAFNVPGSFLLTATETIKSALQKLADYLFGIKVTQTVGVTTITAVDSVAHATYKRVQWIVEVFVTATPANREGFVIDAITDGTNVDDTKYARLKLGANIAGLAASVAINGADLELRIVSTPSVTVNVRRITTI